MAVFPAVAWALRCAAKALHNHNRGRNVTETFYEVLRRQGITRRSFLKFCSLTATSLGLGSAA
ncbi:MAG TPA: twin-arginine translocation signal domain-containing protein, partial [Azonexus sp.]